MLSFLYANRKPNIYIFIFNPHYKHDVAQGQLLEELYMFGFTVSPLTQLPYKG